MPLYCRDYGLLTGVSEVPFLIGYLDCRGHIHPVWKYSSGKSETASYQLLPKLF